MGTHATVRYRSFHPASPLIVRRREGYYGTGFFAHCWPLFGFWPVPLVVHQKNKVMFFWCNWFSVGGYIHLKKVWEQDWPFTDFLTSSSMIWTGLSLFVCLKAPMIDRRVLIPPMHCDVCVCTACSSKPSKTSGPKWPQKRWLRRTFPEIRRASEFIVGCGLFTGGEILPILPMARNCSQCLKVAGVPPLM